MRSARFARLWLASFCSETGEWMLQIALPILVYQATGSATSTAAMMIVGLMPAVLLSPVAGVLADRVERRGLLQLICVGQALVATPLLAMDGAVWLGYVVMAGQAGLASLFEPARNAFVLELVGPDDVNAANGLLGTCTNVSRLVGAWLGGLLFAVGGISWVFAGYATVLLGAALALLSRFGARPQAVRNRAHPLREWLDGLALIRHDRGLWIIGIAMMACAASQGMFLVLFVPFVLDVLGAGPDGVGLLRGVQAIGGLAAGVGVAVLARRVAPISMYGWGSVVFGVLTALSWNGPHVTTVLGVYIGLFIVQGVPGVVAATGLMSTLQTAVSQEATGRLISTAFAAMALGTAAGMLVAGAGVDVVGLPALFDAQASLYVLSGVFVLVTRRVSARADAPDAAVAR